MLLATRHKLTHPHPQRLRASEGWYSIYLPRRDGRLSWPRCPNPRPLGRKSNALTAGSPIHCATYSPTVARCIALAVNENTVICQSIMLWFYCVDPLISRRDFASLAWNFNAFIVMSVIICAVKLISCGCHVGVGWCTAGGVSTCLVLCRFIRQQSGVDAGQISSTPTSCMY